MLFRQSAHLGDIVSAELPEPRGVDRAGEFRIRQHRAVRSAHREDDVVQGLQFARAVRQRMAGDDLLDQCRSRTRHADHEDRHLRRVAAAGFFRDQFAAERRFDAVEQGECGRLVVSDARALGGIAGEEMLERAIVILKVGIGLAEARNRAAGGRSSTNLRSSPPAPPWRRGADRRGRISWSWRG